MKQATALEIFGPTIRVSGYRRSFENCLHAVALLFASSGVIADETESGGAVQASGEAVGGVISGIPSTVGSFFAGVGEGAGVHGFFDWAALLIGVSFLLSTIRGIKRGRIVGPAIRGLIGIALMGWAVS